MQMILGNSDYTFVASTKKITLVTPFDTLDAERILRITNLTTRSVIYDSERRTYSISVTSGVITCTHNTTGMANDDKLQIIVDRYLHKSPTTLNDWTAVAQNTIVASGVAELREKSKHIMYIQAAINTTTPHTGTRFIVETSAAYSGNKDWYPLTDFVALIGTATTDATENDLAVGGKSITSTSHGFTVEGALLFIEDADVAAQGTITMSDVATADDTFVIDTQTFTWAASRTGAGEVTIGASASEAVTNIVTAVTADLTTVTAVDGALDTVVVTAVTAGSAGNSIVFTESSTNMTVDGSGTLRGTTVGVDGTLVNSEIVREASQTTNQIVSLDGVSNTHGTGTNIFNIAMAMNVTLPSTAMRARLVVDNTYDEDGSTLDCRVDVVTAIEE